MKPMEVIQYWKNILDEGEYYSGTWRDRTAAGDVYQIENTYISILEEYEQLNQYTANIQLKEFIFLYALYLTVSKLSNAMAIGIMVLYEDKYYPLIMRLNEKKAIKKEIADLFRIYKENEKAVSNMQEYILKFLNKNEKDFIYGKGHLQFAFENQVYLKKDKESICVCGEHLFYHYNAGIYSDAQAKEFLLRYKHILHQVICNLENTKVDYNKIELLYQEEQKQILQKGQGKIVQNVSQTGIYHRFCIQAEQRGSHTAIYYRESEITYIQLRCAIENISRQLKTHTVGRGSKIVVFCTHTPATIATILAIWKIGGVYVPLLQGAAKEKVNDIIHETSPDLIVFTDKQDAYHDFATKSIKVEFDITNRSIPIIPNEEAEELHIIFTSGTTGKSKGVLIGSEGFTNLCNWYAGEFHYDSESISLLLTNFSFDASVKNIIVPLLTGGILCLGKGELYDAESMALLIQEKSVTHINCVPGLFESILNSSKSNGYRELQTLKYVVLGGEIFRTSAIKTWIKVSNTTCTLANVYGPTEGTDLSTSYKLKITDIEKSNIPIGKPIQNRTVYVLDKELNLVPRYKAGMIYISGMGIIEDYLNRLDAKDKFAENPFEPDMPMYYTGDMGYWNEEDEIIYAGRRDNQIKINGQRIELEELESVAMKHEKLSGCVAVCSSKRENIKEIYLYYQTIDQKEISKEDLVRHFSNWLSSSVLPNEFFHVDRIPLNENGKPNHKELRAIKNKNCIVIAQNRLEKEILQSWEMVLQKQVKTVNRPFFEMGGNSLLLNQLRVELEKKIQLPANIGLIDFFEYPTIRQFAQYIEPILKGGVNE